MQSETSSVKLTISDIIDRCNGEAPTVSTSRTLVALESWHTSLVSPDPKVTGNVEPTSPRSVDACLRLGIEPDELKFITKQHFLKNLEDPDLAELAFKHHETIRQVLSPSTVWAQQLEPAASWRSDCRNSTYRRGYRRCKRRESA